jgi:energy-converting hydrogenase A subunit R
VERQFNTDCEGPISKNDNAFELAEEFIPGGGEFFAKLSKYDDFLADIARKQNYKAGDTLRLILPFLKAYGVTDAGIRRFSSQNILLVPGANTALEYIHSIMPAFMISTSYRPYINSLCELIGFPIENTYCTELALDEYQIPQTEIQHLKQLHDEILALPAIEFPASAVSREDVGNESIACADRLDEIFWGEFPGLASGRFLEEVNPIGGFEKAEAIKKSCEKTGLELADVMYVGDSITDMEAMKLVRDAGGLAVSFNGNRYAVQSADIACISPNALILAALALTFREGGTESVYNLSSEWNSSKMVVESAMKQRLPEFSVEGVSLHLMEGSDMEDLVSQSESFRKEVRGERIGRLG